MENPNNRVHLVGTLATSVKPSHFFKGTQFYGFSISISRLNGDPDILPVIFSKQILKCGNTFPSIGSSVELYGDYRSRRDPIPGQLKSRLILYVNASTVYWDPSCIEVNCIHFGGSLVTSPERHFDRTGTPYISFCTIVPRTFNGRGDYLPCAAYGKDNLKFIPFLKKGDWISFSATIQSRYYPGVDGKVNTAYEIVLTS